jgi:hypothetical protein
MYQNAGENGVLHSGPEDPPRRRANKPQGHDAWETDRPTVLGIVGRESGQVQLIVKKSAAGDIGPSVLDATQYGTTVNTDEWGVYYHLSEAQRKHSTVCHTPGKRVWARDEDGDGIREVHNNTIEGSWTGLRNFLRPFRGVNKICLYQYLALHRRAHNLKDVTLDLVSILCDITQIAS